MVRSLHPPPPHPPHRPWRKTEPGRLTDHAIDYEENTPADAPDVESHHLSDRSRPAPRVYHPKAGRLDPKGPRWRA